MQIRMKDQLSADEALMLLEVANAEVAALRQQLTEHEETIEQLEETNAALRDENRQLKLEMEAVGAGGVSSQRITSTDALQSQDAERLQAAARDMFVRAREIEILYGTNKETEGLVNAAIWLAYLVGPSEQSIDHARRAEGEGE